MGKWAEYKLNLLHISPSPGRGHHVPPHDCLCHLWLQKLGSSQRPRAHCHRPPNCCHFFLFGTEQWLCHEPSPRPESQTFHCFGRMGIWGLHVSNNGGGGRESVACFELGCGRVQVGVWRSSAYSGHECGMFHWWFVIWSVCVWQTMRERESKRETVYKFKRDTPVLYNNDNSSIVIYIFCEYFDCITYLQIHFVTTLGLEFTSSYTTTGLFLVNHEWS